MLLVVIPRVLFFLVLHGKLGDWEHPFLGLLGLTGLLKTVETIEGVRGS